MPTKYSNVVALKNGKFRARLVFPKNPDGTRPIPKDFYGDSKADADRKRSEYKGMQGSRPISIDGSVAFGQFLTDKYLPHEERLHEAGEQCYSNFTARERRVTTMLLDHPAGAILRDVKMSQLRPEHFQEYFEALLGDRIKPRKFNDLRVDLKRALTFGRSKLNRSPDEFFTTVKRRKTVKRMKKLFTPATVIAAIEDESKPLMARLWVAFLFLINCRMNETWALKWTDIRGDTVFFERTVQDAKKGSAITDGTKTQGNDVRREEGVPLGTLLTGLLAQWRKVAPKSEFVFAREDGSPFDRHLFKSEWKKIKKDLGLPAGPGPYSLKTLGLTYKSKNGVPDAVLARLAGHTTTKLVQTNYRYVDADELHSAVETHRMVGGNSV